MQTSIAKSEEQSGSNPQFYYVPTWRLLLLSTSSLGLFSAYWVYKNWSYIKRRDGMDIRPFWRGFWSFFYIHLLLKFIKFDPKTAHIKPAPTYSAGWMTTGFILLSIIGNKVTFFPAELALSLAPMLCLIPAHRRIQKINEESGNKGGYTKWSFGQIFSAAFTPLVYLILEIGLQMKSR